MSKIYFYIYLMFFSLYNVFLAMVYYLLLQWGKDFCCLGNFRELMAGKTY